MTEPTDTQTTQSPKQKLIGLSGLAGSGKTTVAVELVNIFRYNGLSAVRLSFADPIKEAVAAIYAYAGEDA
ncbi:MAG: hypothetical protein KJN60_00180, partial [Boseongicola sp.]|nr:hypothetical protein [Boseongicola sp.]